MAGLTIDYLDNGDGNIGQLRTIVADLLMDDDYPEGGYPINGKDAGVGLFLVGVEEIGSNTSGTPFRVQFNPDSLKLMVTGLTVLDTDYTTALDGADNIPDDTAAHADQAAGPTNFDDLFAEAAISTLTDDTITPVTSPDVPRNIVITLDNTTLGSLDLFEGTTTFTIIGTNQFDEAITEDVLLVSTALNKTVATTKFRFFQGTSIFKTVDEIIITNPPDTDFEVGVGPGSHIGLPELLRTPSFTDVVSATINATPLTLSTDTDTAGGVDVPNNAINVGDVSDADDLIVLYNPTSEVADGTDLSNVVKRVQFLGQ